MKRQPQFIVKMNNRADDQSVCYARKVGSKWLVTSVEPTKHVFLTFWEAEEVQKELANKFSNNKWIDVWIERSDLCESILTDIDNLAEM